MLLLVRGHCERMGVDGQAGDVTAGSDCCTRSPEDGSAKDKVGECLSLCEAPEESDAVACIAVDSRLDRKGRPCRGGSSLWLVTLLNQSALFANVAGEGVGGVEVETVLIPDSTAVVGTCLDALRLGSKGTNPPLLCGRKGIGDVAIMGCTNTTERGELGGRYIPGLLG